MVLSITKIDLKTTVLSCFTNSPTNVILGGPVFFTAAGLLVGVAAAAVAGLLAAALVVELLLPVCTTCGSVEGIGFPNLV